MNPLKKLAGETVIYGFTTILGRFVNWLLVPLYAGIFATGEYGVVINLMSYTALLLVILTYGTETGFFRFGTKDNLNNVFSTLMVSLSFTTFAFLLITFSFLDQIAFFLDITLHKEYLVLLIITISLDVISSIPFALLRLEGRPIRFGIIKLTNIFVNIGFNLFFLVLCPWLEKRGVSVPFYNPDGGILYIFVSYLIASIVTFIMLLPYMIKFKFYFSISLLKKILNYSFPILIVSLAGIINLQGDKIIMPKILGQVMSSDEALSMTGIYGANYKLALVMYIFTQGFRYAFEPFFFRYAENKDSKKVNQDVFLYFTCFGLIIFLGVMYWVDIIKYFLRRPEYYSGIKILPWVLMANLFQGMYYSLSLWYKLTDKTKYGAYMAIIGCVITVSMNVILLPHLGYMASAYAVFTCFLVMCIISLIWGRKHYKINYDLLKILSYFVLAIIFYVVGMYIKLDNSWLTCLARTPLLILFITIFVRREMKFLLNGKIINQMFGKK
ncbi:polysaccharide biosynthesis C-terminal domain-containing protein [Porphyromonadaceae bacterium OttesenSCG-928-L07]|nr:polysaccharide biosynthesis C-terminal domain-containing protein [Porphyromonadaceae bacterium OttesenSCG-928-L07]